MYLGGTEISVAAVLLAAAYGWTRLVMAKPDRDGQQRIVRMATVLFEVIFLVAIAVVLTLGLR